MQHIPHQAEVWEETIVLPTYGVGKPDKNPMFLEKRVYQGSSGRVYPYPVIDKILDEKEDKPYTALWLENDYIRVMILPELGGRIQRAYDKTNGYDFVYYNEVIKPALVGLLGPWISGGIEFNWPQHHRPTTFAPTDWRIVENPDGSRTVECSEVDQMYGTKGKISFTVYPDRAYIEIKGQLYNRTNLPQTFLWWANPAVPVNDNTQSVFPPDVRAVFDHGKRAVSTFPIATGVYYKHDYGAGVDISRYRNIPVPTSYMCAHSDYDFVGGYDYGVGAGVLHVADHHVSPGKKQWTWGCGDFGKAWDRNLTDANGPYIELMTGMYCDNQPDFTWLKPFEEKRFTQYFMPYKAAADAKNANTEAVLNLRLADGQAKLTVYTTGRYPQARVLLTANGKAVYERTLDLSPVDVLKDSVAVDVPETALRLSVYDSTGRELLHYAPQPKKIEEIPDPMPPAKAPEEILTVEELVLTAQHLEQYRHATYLPDDYYQEALRRDAGDIRANTYYGQLLLRRGLFAESEAYFRAAIRRMTAYNPNPYDSEAYLDLGLSLFYQERMDEAYDAFYKATWTAAQQETGYYYLAAISCRRGDYGQALEHIGRSLVRNSHNLKARALKGMILESLGRKTEAAHWLEENLALDAFDYGSRFALCALSGSGEEELLRLMGGRESSFIEAAIDCTEAGYFARALALLKLCPNPGPMTYYYRAMYAEKRVQAEKTAEGGANAQAAAGALPGDRTSGQAEMSQAGGGVSGDAEVRANLEQAAAADPYCCFPNRLEDIAALRFAAEQNPADARAPYYLGCLWYDRRQYEAAIACWEQSAALDADFPTVWRNLALAYFNKRGEAERALACMERAYALDETDARVLLELDQLYRKLGRSVDERLAFLDRHRETAFKRDDLYVEYAALLNLKGRHREAYGLLMAHSFHPWEGGEGKVTAQYALALKQLALEALAGAEAQDGAAGNAGGDAAKSGAESAAKSDLAGQNSAGARTAETAKELLEQALVFPHNLGEGKLEGAKDNDLYFWLGIAERKLGDQVRADAYLARATAGDEEPASAMYYNDQPADLILYEGFASRALGREEHARSRFYKLISYGEKHYYDKVKIDYFAVSLPDLQLFDEDLSEKNRLHCEYLIGLGSLGLGDAERARRCFDEVLAKEPAHAGAVFHRALLESGLLGTAE